MKIRLAILLWLGALLTLWALHFPLISLPYFWDEAGYYIPAAWDFYREWKLVPVSTLPTGHTPLVMIYLAFAWRLFGFSPLVTRSAMILIAAATVGATFALARRVVDREPSTWSAVLLALSPMFFAQSTLVFLDLPTALFTILAVLALLEGRLWTFALTASCAVMTKETALVVLPVAWAYTWRRVRTQRAVSRRAWIALAIPLLPLLAWTVYYHHQTGFWTGNAEYLQYNLYATLDPARVFWSLLRRLYEVFVGGFNWLLVAGAVVGLLWRRGSPIRPPTGAGRGARAYAFFGLTAGLIAVYVLMLSVVGGAVLPRYLLPLFPVFFIAATTLIWQLPKAAARSVCGVTAACFVAAWFIKPPYPFAYENNLAYSDFIRLHQDAAHYLETLPAGERILTAWPATDELSRPLLGYVSKPLHTVPLQGFTAQDFDPVRPDAFDVTYIYSRKWEPRNNWLSRPSVFRRAQERHFGYVPQVRDGELVSHYRLKLLKHFERSGQWVKIYVKENQEAEHGRPK